MKRIAIACFYLFGCVTAFGQEETKDSFYVLSPVEVRAVRAAENAPFTKTNLSKKEISKLNLGQDLPFLLNQVPSVVVNSDAGNGVGYTGIRIRGTDATRINVTLNGIPYNDAESQGTFFVDLPDFASSVGSIQIQRGVGTSSNGAGAFGGSINFSTNEINKGSYADINNSFGSFNTWKNTVKAGTGLLGDHFTADLRLSRISSDGFIDRAKSDLKSFYFSTAYLADKTSLRLNIFSGKEKTYQAWYGISEADLKAGRRTVNYAGTEKPGEPYNNETDNYWQDHYQLFFDHRFSEKLSFNTAFFLVKGKGYYEQYKAGQAYADYGLSLPGNSDFVRQLWLDNDFYGNVFSLQYRNAKTQFVLGGGYSRYVGNHFGELVWASNGLPTPVYRWYDLDALKTDFNIYLREQRLFAGNWYYFYDLQYRHVKHDINGFRDNSTLITNNNYDFFNPKAGITYVRNGWKGYLSYSMANKEPNRDDFEAGINQQPTREQLHDIELGIERTHKLTSWSATLYYMHYKDQLVLTGKINDVGAYTRTNIPKSYRMGIELQGAAGISSWMNVSGNLALSRNKVIGFNEYIDDYDQGGQKLNAYNSTDIAFSPNIVGAATINIIPCRNLELNLSSKYVGKEYLDNTQNETRKLDPFFTQDLRIIYTLKPRFFKEINLTGQVYNLFNVKYEPNGYTYSYITGGETVTENYYFPMAGVNFMVGINVKL
ncbi:MAG TPA: TonB-dependent receptor plug domain-containing protein [Chitinophagaceae bacterium]|nr:TonB-dependent receptor plug domain-containing protein [Chitinophagaceae bacterium]